MTSSWSLILQLSNKFLCAELSSQSVVKFFELKIIVQFLNIMKMEFKIITIILQWSVGVHNVKWGKKYTQKGLIKILSLEVPEVE